jgi:pterin-4a-carbinolamine dehydratase
MEKDQNKKEWIRQIKAWRLNGNECSHLTAKIMTKDYLSKMFFIKDDLLWVRIQTK